MDRQLNHVELVYRVGERPLAKRFFELLGCIVADRGGTFFTAFIDPTVNDFLNNCLYASEVTPEQSALEAALARALNFAPGEVGLHDIRDVGGSRATIKVLPEQARPSPPLGGLDRHGPGEPTDQPGVTAIAATGTPLSCWKP
jgi:hypothetical protein